MTTKTYTVHRSMTNGSIDYLPGDSREMTEADAAELVAMGALSVKGQAPAKTEAGVNHTFGTANVAAVPYVTALEQSDINPLTLSVEANDKPKTKGK